MDGIVYSDMTGRKTASTESLSATTTRKAQPRYKGMLSGMATIAREEGIRVS